MIQVSVVNFDLVILVIVARSFLVYSRSNYYLAFALGLLVSLLSGTPLGLMSIFYLLVVKIIHLFRRSTLSEYWLAVLPLSLALLGLNYLWQKVVIGTTLDLSTSIWQLLLLIPIYLIVGFWEERFSVREQIKLKI